MSDHPLPLAARPAQPAQPPRALRMLALTAVGLGVLVLAAAAFILSYPGIHGIALQAGVSASLARVYPVIFDAMLIIAGAAVLSLRGAGLVSRCYAWLALLALLVAVAGADALHSAAVTLPRRPAAATAAIVPWAMVLIGFGLLLAMLRHARLHRAPIPAPAGAAVPEPERRPAPPSPAVPALPAGARPGGAPQPLGISQGGGAAGAGQPALSAGQPAASTGPPGRSQPGTSQPGRSQPGTSQPGRSQPDASPAYAGQPDASLSDASHPGASPLSTPAQPAAPAAAVPEAPASAVPVLAAPVLAAPVSEVPAAAVPAAAVPAAAVPVAAAPAAVPGVRAAPGRATDTDFDTDPGPDGPISNEGTAASWTGAPETTAGSARDEDDAPSGDDDPESGAEAPAPAFHRMWSSPTPPGESYPSY